MTKEEETLQKREFWGKLQSKIFTIQTLQPSTYTKIKGSHQYDKVVAYPWK